VAALAEADERGEQEHHEEPRLGEDVPDVEMMCRIRMGGLNNDA
jgi:hypothetical protein